MRPSNKVIAVGLVVVAGAFASFPLYMSLSSKARGGLHTREEALTGQQIMRGPYLNSGSHDAGRVKLVRRDGGALRWADEDAPPQNPSS